MRIACVLDVDYEDSEFKDPYDAFRKAGHQVTVIGLKAGKCAATASTPKDAPKTKTARAMGAAACRICCNDQPARIGAIKSERCRRTGTGISRCSISLPARGGGSGWGLCPSGTRPGLSPTPSATPG